MQQRSADEWTDWVEERVKAAARHAAEMFTDHHDRQEYMVHSLTSILAIMCDEVSGDVNWIAESEYLRKVCVSDVFKRHDHERTEATR